MHSGSILLLTTWSKSTNVLIKNNFRKEAYKKKKKRIWNWNRRYKFLLSKGETPKYGFCLCQDPVVKGEKRFITQCCDQRVHLHCYENYLKLAFKEEMGKKEGSIRCFHCREVNYKFPFEDFLSEFKNIPEEMSLVLQRNSREWLQWQSNMDRIERAIGNSWQEREDDQESSSDDDDVVCLD